MIFHNTKGELIELNRYDFKNDKLYYQKIMEVKNKFTKSNEINFNNKKKTNFEDLEENYSNSIINKIIR